MFDHSLLSPIYLYNMFWFPGKSLLRPIELDIIYLLEYFYKGYLALHAAILSLLNYSFSSEQFYLYWAILFLLSYFISTELFYLLLWHVLV